MIFKCLRSMNFLHLQIYAYFLKIRLEQRKKEINNFINTVVYSWCLCNSSQRSNQPGRFFFLLRELSESRNLRIVI